MPADTPNASAEQDWRLQADLGLTQPAGRLDALLGRLGRAKDVVKEVEASVPHDVAITHDGKLLFAYAADEATLAAARRAIESALQHEGVDAIMRTSRWDDELDEWRQTDPPPSAEQRRAQEAADRDAEAVQTRTLVASVGKEIRAEVEQSLQAWARELGVRCEIVEHRHLLTTQIAFTVSGPRRKLDEFARALKAEERATIRTETAIFGSPL
jgi:hypothetical protein